MYLLEVTWCSSLTMVASFRYCHIGAHLTERYGTPHYVAPEVLKQRYDLKCDCWSAGMILSILL